MSLWWRTRGRATKVPSELFYLVEASVGLTDLPPAELRDLSPTERAECDAVSAELDDLRARISAILRRLDYDHSSHGSGVIYRESPRTPLEHRLYAVERTMREMAAGLRPGARS